MLDLLEKIAGGVAILFVVITAGIYLFLKLPSAGSSLFVPEVREITSPEPPPASSPSEPATVSPEIQQVVNLLAEQGRPVSAAVLQKKEYQVPTELFERLSTKADLLPELKTAKHRVLAAKGGDTRLQIYDIEENSILKRFGFQENDVIELIDGQIVTFDKQSSSRYYEMWNVAKEKLRRGESVSVTITRNGRPMHLTFQL